MSDHSHILCIDDDTSTSDWVRMVLQNSHLNCVLRSVGTGEGAFQLLTSEEFDLCITEYALPDMTGVQLSTRLRQSGCNVPIMFFTPMNRAIDREKAVLAGADEYLSKPDDLEIFGVAASRLLKRRRPIYVRPVELSKFAIAA